MRKPITKPKKQGRKTSVTRAKARLTRFLRPRPGWRMPKQLWPKRIEQTVRDKGLTLDDPSFVDFISEIDDQGRIHQKNIVSLCPPGQGAMEEMLAAIKNATCEVLIESYIFSDDQTGQSFLKALAEAAARGVKVWVLADKVGSFDTEPAFWQAMTEAGVRVRMFHRLFHHLLWQGFRNHRKLLVVDRKLAFTGGMNLADAYANPGGRGGVNPGSFMRDIFVSVTGSTAVELADVFCEGWCAADGSPIPDPDLPKAGEGSGASQVHVLEAWPGRGHRSIASTLTALAAGASESLWLANAYFAPGFSAIRALCAAAKRGVDVRLLLPGVTDVAPIRHAGHGWFAALLKAGVRLYEYQPAILHAKVLLADGQVSVVGSSNLDFRSIHFNAECNLVIWDKTFAEKLKQRLETDMDESLETHLQSWSKRGLFHRAGDRILRILSPLM